MAANQPIPRRKAITIGIAGIASTVSALAVLYEITKAGQTLSSRASEPEEQEPSAVTQVSSARKFLKLEELAYDVSHRVGGQYIYSGNLPERRYAEVDFDFLDGMLLNDAVMTGPDTGPLIKAKIEEGRKEVLGRMPPEQQYVMQEADLSKGARVYLKYIPTGQAFTSSETYDPSNNSDLVVSIALYNQLGEIIKRPFAPISLKDLTYIFNPKHEKEIIWQVLDDTRIVYNKKLVG